MRDLRDRGNSKSNEVPFPRIVHDQSEPSMFSREPAELSIISTLTEY